MFQGPVSTSSADLPEVKPEEIAFNLERYMASVGLDHTAGLSRPSVELLSKVVEGQVKHIPYQNFDLLLAGQLPQEERVPGTLDKNKLYADLILRQKGGYCLQLNTLLWHALRDLGFDAGQVPAIVLNNKPYSPEQFPTHIFLWVKLEDKTFLVDVGFGYNSICKPIQVDLADCASATIEVGADRYQLSRQEGHYRLDMEIKGSWFSLYRFVDPVRYCSAEDLRQLNQRLFVDPAVIPIRDQVLKVGRFSLAGERVGLNGFKSPESATAIFHWFQKGEKTDLSRDQLREVLTKQLGVAMSDIHDSDCKIM